MSAKIINKKVWPKVRTSSQKLHKMSLWPNNVILILKVTSVKDRRDLANLNQMPLSRNRWRSKGRVNLMPNYSGSRIPKPLCQCCLRIRGSGDSENDFLATNINNCFPTVLTPTIGCSTHAQQYLGMLSCITETFNGHCDRGSHSDKISMCNN